MVALHINAAGSRHRSDPLTCRDVALGRMPCFVGVCAEQLERCEALPAHRLGPPKKIQPAIILPPFFGSSVVMCLVPYAPIRVGRGVDLFERKIAPIDLYLGPLCDHEIEPP